MREGWLERRASELSAEEREHAAWCEACARWLRVHGAIAAALRGLGRRASPDELDEKVGSWVEPGPDELEDSPVIRALRGLGRVDAPEELRRSLEEAERFDEELEDPRFAQPLRALERHPAPAVLERLVAEELAAPKRQLTERFPGDLERLRAPRSLDLRVARLLRGANRPGVRRAALLLPAAALVVWIGARLWMASAPPPALETPPDLRVVRVESGDLDAFARSLTSTPMDVVGDALGDGLGDELVEEVVDARELVAGWRRGEGFPAIEAPARVRRVLGEETAAAAELPVDGGEPAGEGAPEGGRPASSQRAVAERIARAGGGRVPHAGVRRYHVFERPDDRVRHLAYRELVVTDGSGSFDLDPFQVLTEAERPDRLLLLLDLRAGHLFRHRDFAVRDLELFLANYRLVSLPARVAVAGRPCSLHRVEPRLSGRNAYEIAVDERTGLVLRYLELDPSGEVVAAMEYEHFVEQPDFTAVTFRSPLVQEVPLEELTAEAAADLAGTPAWEPRLLPKGYELRATSVVTEDGGRRWRKLTYLDGVNPLVFMHAPPVEPAVGGTEDLVFVARSGPARTAYAVLRGHHLVAVGRVSDAELVDLFESALP